MTLDTGIPATPAAPDLATASDSGRDDADNITNDDTPTLEGNVGEQDVTVEVYNDASFIASTTSVAGGGYSITLPSQSDGDYLFNVKVIDQAENESVANSANLSVTIDTTAPAMPDAPDLTADTGSSATDNLTNDPTPTFTGSVEGDAIVHLWTSDGPTKGADLHHGC